jgi:hypothetical protein
MRTPLPTSGLALAAALNVTLNILRAEPVASAAMALNLVAAAGISIQHGDDSGNATVSRCQCGNQLLAVQTASSCQPATFVSALQFDQLDGTGTITGHERQQVKPRVRSASQLVNTLDSNGLDTVAEQLRCLM